jgi:hypothetical protein
VGVGVGEEDSVSAGVSYSVLISCSEFYSVTNAYCPSVNTGSRMISSAPAAVVGNQLSVASYGTWANPAGGSLTYGFQWYRCSTDVAASATCSPISGATNSSYTVQSTDLHSYISLMVIASNSGGSVPSSLAAPVGEVT